MLRMSAEVLDSLALADIFRRHDHRVQRAGTYGQPPDVNLRNSVGGALRALHFLLHVLGTPTNGSCHTIAPMRNTSGNISTLEI